MPETFPSTKFQDLRPALQSTSLPASAGGTGRGPGKRRPHVTRRVAYPYLRRPPVSLSMDLPPAAAPPGSCALRPLPTAWAVSAERALSEPCTWPARCACRPLGSRVVATPAPVHLLRASGWPSLRRSPEGLLCAQDPFAAMPPLSSAARARTCLTGLRRIIPQMPREHSGLWDDCTFNVFQQELVDFLQIVSSPNRVYDAISISLPPRHEVVNWVVMSRERRACPAVRGPSPPAMARFTLSARKRLRYSCSCTCFVHSSVPSLPGSAP